MLNEILKKIQDRVRTVYLNGIGTVVRKLRAPQLPSPAGPVLIHIGCGEINDPRFINIDARPFPHVHKVTTSLRLEDFESNTVDLIYSCHVVEHVSFREVAALFSRWRDTLKEGGIVRISVPDFDHIVAMYGAENRNINSILPALMGGQDYPFNFHYAAFNAESLTQLFLDAGFSKVEKWDPKNITMHSFDDWAGRELEIGTKKYPISLNMQAIK